MREGLDETLMVQALGITGSLYRTLRTTDPIENLNSSVARYCRNVKRWGDGQMALLPPYSPDLNPVEYLWAWLKRHALANFCPRSLTELKIAARNKPRSGQRRQSIITACWKQAELW